MPERPVVAHYHDNFFNRSETFIYNLIAGLRRFEPVCFARAFSNGGEFPFPDEKKHLLLRPNLISKLLRRDFAAVSALRASGARILHAHFGLNGVTALQWASRLGIPLVVTFYGYDVSEFARHASWRRRYRRLFAGGDLFLVEGECMKAKLAALGCPENKILIQRIAVPVSKIPFRERGGAADRPAVFLFAGRFMEKKGVLQALGAMKILRTRRQDFEFRLIGDGPQKAEIESAVRGGMEGYVKLLGFLDYASYLREMALADIFLHPSVTAANGDDEGGAPTTILEAQAAGLPVLATRHADIPNVVTAESALLSAERDAEELAANAETLLSDRKRWGAMGRAGRAFVETRHGLQSGVECLEEIYSSLI